ncbi:MAG: hypothetical protein EOP49_21980, partial [Sphingobacteriales bacterium]
MDPTQFQPPRTKDYATPWLASRTPNRPGPDAILTYPVFPTLKKISQSMTSAREYYSEIISAQNTILSRLKARLGLIAVARFVSFIAMVYCIYQLFKGVGPIPGLGLAIALVVFIGSLRFAFRLQDKKKLTEKLIWLNQNELTILNGGKNLFDNGAKYAGDGGYSGDLDIFGHGSVFGLLNRTTTSHGSDALSMALGQPFSTPGEITDHQQAVKVLSLQHQSRQLITAHGLLHTENEGTLHDIRSWLTEPNRLVHRKWLLIARYLVPAYNLGSLHYLLDTGNEGPLLIGLAVAWIIIGSFSKYIFSQHALITKKQAILDQYASILRMFNGVDPKDSSLLQRLRKEAQDADIGIHQLARLAAAFDQRLNLIVFAVLNGIFLYDIQCMWKLEQWKSACKSRFDQWIRIVGDIEFLNSVSGFAFNNPAYTYPELREEMVITAVDMAHPLIPLSQNVANSLETGIDEQLIILTGSNMSGKTTFLRTLGVNLVLAQAGAPVNASKFIFKPLVILSSIRVGDSLQENTSYFMAELKKLRKIIDVLETGVPALVLIDEILRGTNSDDKTHGSEQFIRKLINYRCLTLFATHDLSLSVLENELAGRVNNYCFESVIRNGELLFDYTLQRGVASNKNASFLMQKMNII